MLQRLPKPFFRTVLTKRLEWFHWAGQAFFNLTYVDDGVIVALDVGYLGLLSAFAYDWVLFRVLGDALNQKKLATTGVLENTKTVWGIVFDLSRVVEGPQFAFVTLTSSKFVKMRAFAERVSMQPGQRLIRRSDHDEIVGNVQWWSTCAAALRALLPMFYIMSRGDGEYISPAGDPVEQARAWEEYDEAR